MSAYVRECFTVFGKLTERLLHEACKVPKTELTISSAFAATGMETACIGTHFVDLRKGKSSLVNFRTIICDLGLLSIPKLVNHFSLLKSIYRRCLTKIFSDIYNHEFKE
jgi:hypothetical protein